MLLQCPDKNNFRMFQIGHYQELMKQAVTIEHKSFCRKEIARLSQPPYHTKNENHVQLITNHSGHADRIVSYRCL